MGREAGELELSVGWASETGPRPRNDDFGGAYVGTAEQQALHGSVAAIADGIGGAGGGRAAAETAVRGFIDAYYEQSGSLDVERAAARALEPLNRWIVAQARSDAALKGMGTTFSALILREQDAHVVHVGDSRIYRWRQGRLELLTSDHTLESQGLSHVLYRALGIEDALRLDYERHEVRPHDRFLLCTDGVHGVLSDGHLASHLGQSAHPDEIARRLVRAALGASGQDNASALVVDVVRIAAPGSASLERASAALPIKELPKVGQNLDGYVIERQLSDGRYSRLFLARQERDGSPAVLKFPQPGRASDAIYRLAYAREAWVAAQVRNPWIADVAPISAERQSQLYVVMPFYDGETLEVRLLRAPKLSIAEGIDIAGKLAKGLAALHRAGIIHRDLKPENVILLPDGGLKIVDLGVARVPKLDEIAMETVPGTASYMAPEMFTGAPGDERTDQFALAVTLYRSLAGGAYPYGEIEPFSHPRFGRPTPLSRHRPDGPAWLDFVLARALAPNPDERFGDVIEFASELENGLMQVSAPPPRPLALYERNPLLFWKLVSLALFIGLVSVLLAR